MMNGSKWFKHAQFGLQSLLTCLVVVHQLGNYMTDCITKAGCKPFTIALLLAKSLQLNLAK